MGLTPSQKDWHLEYMLQSDIPEKGKPSRISIHGQMTYPEALRPAFFSKERRGEGQGYVRG